MVQVYAKFAREFMALPVIVGHKSPNERFAGALDTLTIEAMMQDGRLSRPEHLISSARTSPSRSM